MFRRESGDEVTLERKGVSSGHHMYERESDPLRVMRIFVPLMVAALLILIPVIVVSSLDSSGSDDGAAAARAERSRKLPPFYTVRAGDTYGSIAAKTGLTVEDLESFNPETDPSTIQPGEKLKLRAHVPAPPPPRKGPKWWTVKPGESFGSIAAATKKNILVLQRLNPKVKPENMQPGMRIRLRK